MFYSFSSDASNVYGHGNVTVTLICGRSLVSGQILQCICSVHTVYSVSLYYYTISKHDEYDLLCFIMCACLSKIYNIIIHVHWWSFWVHAEHMRVIVLVTVPSVMNVCGTGFCVSGIIEG